MADEAKHPQDELEKRIFYLKTLYDLSQEIGYLRETQEIIENLLLMIMGTFGTSRGFILLRDKAQKKIDAFTQRGFSPESFNLLVQKLASGEDEKEDILSSLNLKVWVPLDIDSNMSGDIGLGERLTGDPYLSDDQELLSTMVRQGAVAIENARLNQARIETLEQSRKELEQLNKAKSRALDHLSHELRTPLSVVQGNIRLLKKKTQSQTPPLIKEEIYESLEKNLNRLSEIQQETDQIIRCYEEMEKKHRLGSILQTYSVSPEIIQLRPFADRVVEEIKTQSRHRDIRLDLEGLNDLTLSMDPKILGDMLIGLLKNAIENTPDEGMIKLILDRKGQWIQIKVMDFGIGITKENQRHLWDGLFHTLDTELYTSGKPYDFGAGGKGLNLLRMKAYAQRYGFDISVGSERCRHLPTDRDLCPGKISKCLYCKKTEDCYSSGGSTFCLSFPV